MDVVNWCSMESQLPFVLWYSARRPGEPAYPLQNADGSLKPNGEAFRDFVATSR